MLKLFFEKNQKILLQSKDEYFRVSNNLDSHFYVIEKVLDKAPNYVINHYFMKDHPQLISYFNCWNQTETVVKNIQELPKLKEKKSTMLSLLSKKSKDHSKTVKKVQTPQQSISSHEQEVLYIQLESFSEVIFPEGEDEQCKFMALIYVLAMRIKFFFGQWPRMIPVIGNDRKFKFVKKGQSELKELINFRNYISKGQLWQQQLLVTLGNTQNQIERQEKIGNLIKQKLYKILTSFYKIQEKRGQQRILQQISLVDPFTLLFKEEQSVVNLKQYKISYYHQDSETRQIILEHNLYEDIILEGQKHNFIIKYLKQLI